MVPRLLSDVGFGRLTGSVCGDLVGVGVEYGEFGPWGHNRLSRSQRSDVTVEGVPPSLNSAAHIKHDRETTSRPRRASSGCSCS